MDSIGTGSVYSLNSSRYTHNKSLTLKNLSGELDRLDRNASSVRNLFQIRDNSSQSNLIASCLVFGLENKHQGLPEHTWDEFQSSIVMELAFQVQKSVHSFDSRF